MAGEQQQRQSYYEGQTATNPQTGERLVYRQERWQALDSASGAPGSRETLEAERARLNTLRRTAELGGEFLNHNQERETGGVLSDAIVPTWGQPHRQAMESLTSQMVRANIQPGQAGTMNSNAEQEMVRAQYPNAQTQGDENGRRVLNLYVEAELQQRRIAAMEQWVQQNRSLDGFSAAWGAQERSLRPTIEHNYRQRMNMATGTAVGAVAGGGQTAAGNDFVRDPATGRIVPARR